MQIVNFRFRSHSKVHHSAGTVLFVGGHQTYLKTNSILDVDGFCLRDECSKRPLAVFIRHGAYGEDEHRFTATIYQSLLLTMPCIGKARVGHSAPNFHCDAVVDGEFIGKPLPSPTSTAY